MTVLCDTHTTCLACTVQYVCVVLCASSAYAYLPAGYHNSASSLMQNGRPLCSWHSKIRALLNLCMHGASLIPRLSMLIIVSSLGTRCKPYSCCYVIATSTIPFSVWSVASMQWNLPKTGHLWAIYNVPLYGGCCINSNG